MSSPTHKKSLQSKNSDLRDMGVFLDPAKTSFFYLAGRCLYLVQSFLHSAFTNN